MYLVVLRTKIDWCDRLRLSPFLLIHINIYSIILTTSIIFTQYIAIPSSLDIFLIISLKHLTSSAQNRLPTLWSTTWLSHA